MEAELADQRTNKTSLEQRGVAVVTTSGVLVTLLFAMAAVVTKRENFQLPTAAEPWLYAALASFVLAAACGLLATVPLRYKGAAGAALHKVAVEKWDDSARVALRRVTVTRIKILASYRRGNNLKGRILAFAIGLEMLAVFALAVAVGIVISHGPN